MLLTISFETEDERGYFETLYLTYRERMFTIACSILKNESDAEDAVSTAFLTLSRRIFEMRGEPDYKTASYLYKAAKHSALNIRRTQKRHGGIHTDLNEIAETLPDEGDDPGSVEWIVEEIGKMDEISHDVLSLSYLNGLKPDEIAEVLHITVNTVRIRLSRGRKKLAEQIRKSL